MNFTELDHSRRFMATREMHCNFMLPFVVLSLLLLLLLLLLLMSEVLLLASSSSSLVWSSSSLDFCKIDANVIDDDGDVGGECEN